MRVLPAAAISLLYVGCAASPPPASLANLDEVRSSRAATESSEAAPQAFQEAERLREEAQSAWKDGERELANDLSEEAAVAYERAILIARLARAEQLAATSRADVEALNVQLAELDTAQKKLQTEARDLELRAKVVQDALPLPTIAPAAPEREAARRAAASALLTEAKLLCVSEVLVASKRSQRTQELLEKIEETASRINTTGPAATLGESRGLRSECLQQLTLARRPATRQLPNAGLADALLSGLSNTGEFQPFRDDRGVVVLLGDPVVDGHLTADTSAKLSRLSRIAAEHPRFALLVVWHSGKKPLPSRDEAVLLETVRGALAPNATTTVTVESAGNTQPLSDSGSRAKPAATSRLEVVFVSPSSS